MSYSLTGFILTILFFASILFFIALGRRVGQGKATKMGFDITEGAVFSLLALLVTFTFSGASQRFDHRRTYIVEEANAISTAYLRLDMFADSDAKILRQDFKDYVAARLNVYHALPDVKKASQQLMKASEIQTRLWQHTMQASKNPAISFAPMLVVPAVNNMFDIANTRLSHALLHPPILIFILLIGVLLLSSFLTGYGMVGRGKWHSLHIVAFALVTAATIYVIIELEFPRLGFIQESEFDQFLVDVQSSMR